MSQLPMAGDGMPEPEKRRLAAKERDKLSASLANDTQWNELPVRMRAQDGWAPSYP